MASFERTPRDQQLRMAACDQSLYSVVDEILFTGQTWNEVTAN